MAPKPIKLSAMDRDDLGVISACLQDALTRTAEMTYLPREKRFVCTLNRFMWEAEDETRVDGKLHHRIRSGVHFNGVSAARLKDIRQEAGDDLLELLAIECEGDGDGASDVVITLVLAGGGLIRLEADCIDCALTDMGSPWTTTNRPSHQLEEDLT